MTTLQEALSRGRGIERPFNCMVHDDKNASAYVNVVKGLWFCHSCHASGSLDGPIDVDPHDLVTQVNEILSDKEISVYPESWLTLYKGTSEYWESRFTQRAIDYFDLGFDPVKEMSCYPLRNPIGEIHGLVYRNNDPTSKRKYKYPYGINISNYMFNYSRERRDTVVLVEGAADAIALWEIGIEAFAVLGNHPSNTHINLIKRVEPKRIVLAFDMDSGGNSASVIIDDALGGQYEVVRATWDDNLGKDPAELNELHRSNFIGSLVV